MLVYGKVLLKMLDTMTVINPHLEGKTRTGTLPLTTEVHQHLNSPYKKKQVIQGRKQILTFSCPVGQYISVFSCPH